jgi:tetratricopeptide (TPR) repeat protein
MEDSDMFTGRNAEGTTLSRASEWLRKGQECEARHRLSSAIKAYEHAARSADSAVAASANYCLGRLYEERHRYTSAIRAFRRAANCTDRGLRTSANYHLGRIYEHRHHLASAIGAYRRAARTGTGDDAAHAHAALARLRI